MAFMDDAMDPGMMAGLARLEREKELARRRYAGKSVAKRFRKIPGSRF